MNLTDYKQLYEIRFLMDYDLPKAKQKLTNLLKEYEEYILNIDVNE